MIDYVRLEFDATTKGNLFQFCLEQRLGLADVGDQSPLTTDHFKFHVTIMYSKVTNSAFEEGIRDFKPHILQPDAFDMFGPEKDHLVLRLHPDTVLTELHDYYRLTYGHVSDFSPFLPHLTIRGSDAKAKNRIDTLPLPNFELRAERLIHQIKIG